MYKVLVKNTLNTKTYEHIFEFEDHADDFMLTAKQNNVWRLPIENIILEKSNYDVEWQSKLSIKFLEDTDWKVIRHRDQLALNQVTSLTNQEYQDLLQERQDARDNTI